MTKRQVERAAQCLHKLAVAVFLGAWGDLILINTRITVDVVGICASILMFAYSLKLTGWMGGPRI